MLQNAYFIAKIGADTAENEQHFAEILPIGRRVADICLGDDASTTKMLRYVVLELHPADCTGPYLP